MAEAPFTPYSVENAYRALWAWLTAQGATVPGVTAPGVSSSGSAAAVPSDNQANAAVESVRALNALFDGALWDLWRMAPSGQGGAAMVAHVRPNTGTVTSVADSATVVTLLASLATRMGATIYNDSDQPLYVKFGTAASLTSFTVRIAPGGYYEVPNPCYTGAITGIWTADSTGSARITELV